MSVTHTHTHPERGKQYRYKVSRHYLRRTGNEEGGR